MKLSIVQIGLHCALFLSLSFACELLHEGQQLK